MGDQVSFYGDIYSFEATRILTESGTTENIPTTAGWIELTYTTTYLNEDNISVTETVPYQDVNERLWIGGTLQTHTLMCWTGKINPNKS